MPIPRGRLRVLLALLLVCLLLAAGCGMPSTQRPKAIEAYPCKPKGKKPYCAHSTYRAQVDDAWQWSEDHTDPDDRDPVPYPTKFAKYTAIDAEHVVYVVTYKPKGGGERVVWKYGQTNQHPWQDRAKVGKRTCERSKLDQPGTCDIDWVAVTAAKPEGYYKVRFMEASMIKHWSLGHGTPAKPKPCPPGQESPSCR